MKGHVPTPTAVVEVMVEKLFAGKPPRPSDRVLDPGCGDGAFIAGVLRWCRDHRIAVPHLVGVELNPSLAEVARKRFSRESKVEILNNDYLKAATKANYIIGNPPYVSIASLTEAERASYRRLFKSAVGRFDLYLLFFERSVQNLEPGGRLCFITPEKFEYVETAKPLRALLASHHVSELHHVGEETFEGLVTYPTITTLVNEPSKSRRTRITFRDGRTRSVRLPADGRSWNGTVHKSPETSYTATLDDVALRISCGTATGADEIYVFDAAALPPMLFPIARPTISGRQLGLLAEGAQVECRERMLVPYNQNGVLLNEKQLGVAIRYFSRRDVRAKLEARTCVTKSGRVYYSFHDSAPLPEMLRPKILCKDIGIEPKFWIDRTGDIVPRHSVYYIVPAEGVDIDALYGYLVSAEAKTWLRANVQRAANGYYRLQSTVLKRLPVPARLEKKRARAKSAAAAL